MVVGELREALISVFLNSYDTIVAFAEVS